MAGAGGDDPEPGDGLPAASTTSGCSRGWSSARPCPRRSGRLAGKAVRRDGHSSCRSSCAGSWPTAARSSTPGARSSSATTTPRPRPALDEPSLPALRDDPPRDLPRRPLPRPRPAGDRRRRGVRRRRDRRHGLGRAAPRRTGSTDPLRNQWLTDPLALDCAFQMMILWSVERTGAGLAADLRRPLPPVPPGLPGRGGPGGRPGHRGRPAQGPGRRRLPRRPRASRSPGSRITNA